MVPYGRASVASIDVERENDAVMIVVRCTGLWSERFADKHFAALATLIEGQPDRARGVNTLIDLREWPVQPAETASRVSHWVDRLYGPTDRVAMLVASSLVKAQLRRVTHVPTHEYFLSESAARMWLLAYATGRVAAA